MVRKLYVLLSVIGIVVLGFVAGWFIGKNTSFFSPKSDVSSSVVIENIEKVLKLTTIESTMSELYKYQDYYSFDLSPFRKKALLRVNAKVAAGYDFKKFNMKVDSSKKQVILTGFPSPEILSIDHNLDYFDLEQGMFNSFTNEDYNHINTNAKEYIRKVALNKGLLTEAENHKKELIDLWTLMLRGMGYELVVVPEPNPVYKQ